MCGSAERLAWGEAAQGVITAISKRRAARPAVHAFGRRQLARRADGTPSWPSGHGHGRGARGQPFPWGTGCWPPGGAPAQGWSEKSASLGTVAACSPSREGAYKKGPLTPTSLEVWTPESGPPGPGPSLRTAAPGYPLETVGRPGEFQSWRARCPPDSRGGLGRGWLCFCCLHEKTQARGPLSLRWDLAWGRHLRLDLAAPQRHRAQPCQGNLTLSDTADAADSAAPARRRASLDDCQPDAIPQATNQES